MKKISTMFDFLKRLNRISYPQQIYLIEQLGDLCDNDYVVIYLSDTNIVCEKSSRGETDITVKKLNILFQE